MKEYLEHIIIPYFRGKHVELKLAPDHLALQYLMYLKVTDILVKENIYALHFLANCTDRL